MEKLDISGAPGGVGGCNCGHACAAMHALISSGHAALIFDDDAELGTQFAEQRPGQNIQGEALTRVREYLRRMSNC